MGVRILKGYGDMAALYCSTSGVAFGPVFSDDDDHTADERAEAFCRFLKQDARSFSDSELQLKYSAWLVQEAQQWQAEADAEKARLALDDD